MSHLLPQKFTQKFWQQTVPWKKDVQPMLKDQFLLGAGGVAR